MRPDLSEQLIHLTKGDTIEKAAAAFSKIMSDRALLGGSGDVRGKYTVVCFSEAPVEIIARIFENPTLHGFRYRPFGVMVPKKWLFLLGGRPVIYQPDSEYETLPEEIKYRHVRLEEPGGKKDFTFEREWRIHTKKLPLDPKECTLVVPTRDWDYRLREEHNEKDSVKARAIGRSPFERITSFDWHVLALGDLGTRINLNE